MKYTATFADGSTRVRRTDRTYAAAWRATKTVAPEDARLPALAGLWTEYGFARTAELAEKQRVTWTRKGWKFEVAVSLTTNKGTR